MKKLILLLRILHKLGFANVLVVALFKLKNAFLPSQIRFNNIGHENIFLSVKNKINIHDPLVETHKNQAILFSWKLIRFKSVPAWHYNYLSEKLSNKQNIDSSKISDFIEGFGDIKGVWELSRFEWMLSFAIHSSSGNETYLKKINEWTNDWIANNPPYSGLNWKCGQEASIRLINLCLSTLFLNVSKSIFSNIIKMHLKKIKQNHRYALAQRNNHAVSEAAALYIGNSYLGNLKDKERYFKEINKLVLNLFHDDGTFAQYSTNYQRMVLNTINIVEIWRSKFDKELKFSEAALKKIKLGGSWLETFISGTNGEVPNTGHNDGANVFTFHENTFLDHRYVVELSSLLFSNETIYPDILFPENIIDYSRIKKNKTRQNDYLRHFNDGGFIISKIRNSKVFLRHPEYKFRPAHCDSLNIDVWINGRNVIRDAGTYSYNFSEKKLDYYSGDIGQNVIQIGNSNEMPRISRFLYGNWPKTHNLNVKDTHESNIFSAKVKKNGVMWNREVIHLKDKIKINDILSRTKKNKVFRLRLINESFKTKENKIIFSDFEIEFKSSLRKIIPFNLSKGFESLRYYEENEINIIEINLLDDERLETIIRK